MTGKLIIFAIAMLMLWAGAVKLAARLGIKPAARASQPASDKPRLPFWKLFFRSKFNLAMAGLAALYLIWGLTQLLGQ